MEHIIYLLIPSFADLTKIVPAEILQKKLAYLSYEIQDKSLSRIEGNTLKST